MSSSQAASWAVEAPPWISAKLVVSNGKRYDLDKNGVREFRLGRLQDILIEHQTASRFHATIAHHKDGGLYIIDNKSANGTFVDGKEISPNVPIRLEDGSKLVFGECADVFRIEMSDRRENAKKEMITQLASYADDDVVDEDGPRFVSAGMRSDRGQSRGWARDVQRSDRSARNGRHEDGERERDDDRSKHRGRENTAVLAIPTGSGVSEVAQKRKMLWGSKAKEDSTKNTATWSTLSSTLRNPDAQDKFMKLMGGKKAGNEVDGSVAEVVTNSAKVDIGGMQHALEQEYRSALMRSQGNCKHGLG